MLATHSSVVGEKIFQDASVFGHENLADGFPIVVVRWLRRKKEKKIGLSFFVVDILYTDGSSCQKIRNKNNKNKIKKKEIKGKKRIETGNGLND